MEALFLYEIRVLGQLPDGWSDWFEGLSICNLPSGEVTLSGALPDQAALLGILNRLHALNLIVISMYRFAG